MNITERKRAEQALREREQQLSSIYDTVADVIFQLAVEKDGRYRFTSVNRAFLSVTGLDYAQVVGKWVEEVIPEPSLSLVLEKYGEAIREKRIVRWEETSEYPTGRLTGEVSVAPVFDDGNCTHLVGAVQDITERKRAEQHLAAQYAVARCLAESHALADAAPKILQAICESLEWDQGEVWSVLWNADLQANVLRCVGTWHPPSASFPEFEAVTRQIEFASGVGLPGRVWASGEPAWIPDVTQDANFPRAPVAAKEGLRAGFAFPLKSDGGVLGVMGFFSREIRQPDNDLLQ